MKAVVGEEALSTEEKVRPALPFFFSSFFSSFVPSPRSES